MTGVRAALVALLAAAVLALHGGPTASAGDPALAALAPVLVHDRDERFRATSVSDASARVPGRAGEAPGPVVYGREAGPWRQYWIFFASNPQDRGILRSGRHAGDWEMVQFRVDGAGRPVEAVYAQHSGAERCGWSDVEQRGGRPVVYLANGSHAAYFHAGTRDRTWPDPNDEADGRGAVQRPRLEVVSADSPAWMRYPGPWGGARAGWFWPEQSSPHGPAFQPQGRWSDPAAWAAAARPCTARRCVALGACDGREDALAGGFGALAVAAVVIVFWRRRRRTPLGGEA